MDHYDPYSEPLFINSREVARRIGMDPSTITRAAQRGGLTIGEHTVRPIKVNRRVMWPTVSINAALNYALTAA